MRKFIVIVSNYLLKNCDKSGLLCYWIYFSKYKINVCAVINSLNKLVYLQTMVVYILLLILQVIANFADWSVVEKLLRDLYDFWLSFYKIKEGENDEDINLFY